MALALEERQASILEATIREYIRTAEPVSSLVLADHYRNRIAASPATIRNDMVELEEDGYLRQPHTSAGRVPTEQAYRYYVEHFLKDRSISRREAVELEQAWSPRDDRKLQLKRTAKLVAAFSSESAFVAFGPDDLYFTGLANLLHQPEFTDERDLVNVGAMIDQLDEALLEIYPDVSETVAVLIGGETKLSSSCSVIVMRWCAGDFGEGIFGLLGPTRMDYDANVARVKFVRERVSAE